MAITDMRAALRCHAKAKRTGERCGAPAAYGGKVCYVHGARKTTVSGEHHPNWKHGRRSKEGIERKRRSRADVRFLNMCVRLITRGSI